MDPRQLFEQMGNAHIIVMGIGGTPQGDVSVVREGTKIIVPEGMPMAEVQEWARRMEQEENTTVGIHEVIDAYPLEGAYALSQVLKSKYGFTSLAETPGFFGPKPPSMLSVKIDTDTSVQVPWGNINIPGVGGAISTRASFRNGRWTFVLSGEVKRKNERDVLILADMVRAMAMTSSIYRGKAIELTFEDDPEEFDIHAGPKILDTSKVNRAELIFSDSLMHQVEVDLFTPVERTTMCRKIGIPLKRGVLMSGPYGVGKSLTSNVLKQLCVQNGWTFISITKVEHLARAVQFAKNYQPAVVFAEDADEALKGERDDTMNEVLNTIDGIDSKGMEIMVVLTTNNVHQIHKAMIRPGRIDSVISVEAPDAVAVTKLIHLYGRGFIDESSDLTRVGELLAGHIPAVIREVLEKTKLARVRNAMPGEYITIRAEHLIDTIFIMGKHLSLMKEPEPDTSPKTSHITLAFDKNVQFSVGHNGSNGHKKTESVEASL
jgi:transitional endoplasmic reticulum ATPase